MTIINTLTGLTKYVSLDTFSLQELNDIYEFYTAHKTFDVF